MPYHSCWVLEKPQRWPKGLLEALILQGEPRSSKAPALRGFQHAFHVEWGTGAIPEERGKAETPAPQASLGGSAGMKPQGQV